ncbi:hypothetical protein QFC19_002998 [Naganishia cerealis]|uniref:Uncharacterized protein n=1 Tax=Naganishia cerealis TaxID=610337 RepID=A0ACC2W544_9TREE|nr:hypothetical protein QFC19_002998 [Naganishia cerealis]
MWYPYGSLAGLMIVEQAILSVIGSISFPWSFPFDLMHLLFENVIKTLFDIWSGTFKPGILSDPSLDTRASYDYVISADDWKAIAREVAASNHLVPSSIARRLHDINARGFWTAETWMYFLLFLGPIVLKGRLHDRYFLHYLQLSGIARTITGIEISGDDLDSIEKGLAHWVADYERLYYRCSPNNLPFGTAPIHGLLHLAKYIRMQGPPAVYWGFSTERFVGWLKTASYNRQLPVTALGNIVETQEQIHQVLSTLGDDNFHKVIMWERGRKARPTWMQDHSEAKLFERMSDNYQFNNAELHCLYNFLTARAFESDHIWMRYERVNVTMAEVAATTFRVFSAWRSNDDDGRQTYRTQESHRAVTRDASWCRFDQIRDRNERRASGPAVWQRIAQPLWGEVLHFVEFSWREETLQVAIVQSWNTQPWLSGRERAVFADTAWELTTKGCLLAMEVRSLRHVAARVKLDGRHEKYVIFETSLGLLVPELI